MGMLSNILILTQNKMSIVEPCKQIYINHFREDGRYHIITNYNNGDYDDLGRYRKSSTCEQIVLDILKAIASGETSFIMPPDN